MKEENFKFIEMVSNAIKDTFEWVSNDVTDYIASQSALETAYGKSTICKENHNYFGMKLAKSRIGTTCKDEREHAKYYSLFESIVDYFFWCSYNLMLKKDFYDLDRFKTKMPFWIYCPNANYKTNIDQIYKSYKTEKERKQND